MRTAVPIGEPLPGSERLVLQAVYPVAERLGALADTVQAAYKQFGEKDYLREPLKASFILTLTVVLLLSLLARLVRRDLHRAAAGAADPGPREGHARGRRRATSTRDCRSRRTTRWASSCTRSTT